MGTSVSTESSASVSSPAVGWGVAPAPSASGFLRLTVRSTSAVSSDCTVIGEDGSEAVAAAWPAAG